MFIRIQTMMMSKNMLDFKLLKQLYTINSHSRQEQEICKFLVNYLKTHYTGLKIKTDDLGNIYVTKGKSKYFPTIVSHVDQVQSFKGHLNVLRQNDVISAYDDSGKQQGLGADDKNGVWIALMLLRTEPVLKAAFFVGEEIGCIGSSKCDMKFFKDSKYVLQCDRRGGKDIIYETYSTELAPYDFIPDAILTKYGYFPAYGLMTDVETLKERGLEVACCNMSCGYYDPHTSIETTKVSELINCLNFVKEIIANVPLTKHKYDSKFNSKYFYSNYGGYGQYPRSSTPQSANNSALSSRTDKSWGKYYDWNYSFGDDIYDY